MIERPDNLPAENLAVAVLDGRGGTPDLYTVERAGAWIGRGPEVDIKLDDASQPLSPRHARIDWNDGAFWLTDQGAGGLFLNGDPTPLPQGARRWIKIGDVIRLGSYELRIRAGQRAIAEALADLTQPSRTMPGIGEPPSARDMLAEMLDEWQLDDIATPTSTNGVNGAKAQPNPLADPLATIVSDLQRATDGSAPPAPSDLPRFGDEAPQLQAPPVQPPPVAIPQPRSVLEAVVQDAIAAPPFSAGPTRESAAAAMEDPFQLLKSDSATAALAAFWWSLGIMPQVQEPNALFHLMGELGAAFREMTNGLAAQINTGDQDRGQKENLFAEGQSGLRRFVNTAGKDGGHLADWVRQGFDDAGRGEDAIAERVGDAVHNLVQDLSVRAIEEKLRPLARPNWYGSRRASYWRLFKFLSDDIGNMAEMRFHQDVNETLRSERRRASYLSRRKSKA